MPESTGVMRRHWPWWFAFSALIIVLDQWTKTLADTGLHYGVPVKILPVFNLTLQYNYGAAFSFLSDAGGWQRWLFTVIAVIVSAVIALWLYRLKSDQRLLAAGLALVLGGALGNLYDRVVLGYVIDFISVHYQGWYFPAFNLADSAITLGAGLLILDMLRNPHHHR